MEGRLTGLMHIHAKIVEARIARQIAINRNEGKEADAYQKLERQFRTDYNKEEQALWHVILTHERAGSK